MTPSFTIPQLHTVLSESERQAIVNALAYYYDAHTIRLDADMAKQYQMAFHEDNRYGAAAITKLADKIATLQ